MWNSDLVALMRPKIPHTPPLGPRGAQGRSPKDAQETTFPNNACNGFSKIVFSRASLNLLSQFSIKSKLSLAHAGLVIPGCQVPDNMHVWLLKAKVCARTCCHTKFKASICLTAAKGTFPSREFQGAQARNKKVGRGVGWGH